MNRSCVAIFSIASMLTATVNSALAQDRVQAGTLVCNTSMDLGAIVGSREALNCTFTPSVASENSIRWRDGGKRIRA